MPLKCGGVIRSTLRSCAQVTSICVTRPAAHAACCFGSHSVSAAHRVCPGPIPSQHYAILCGPSSRWLCASLIFSHSHTPTASTASLTLSALTQIIGFFPSAPQVLHWLDTVPPADLFAQLVGIAYSAVWGLLTAAPSASFPAVARVLAGMHVSATAVVARPCPFPEEYEALCSAVTVRSSSSRRTRETVFCFSSTLPLPLALTPV